jgi:hypothetical protein
MYYLVTMKILREDWERVFDKACDIANATEEAADPMYAVHLEGMMRLLDELERKYGQQSRILATRADYLESFSERRALYERALELATNAHDTGEMEEIMDSLNRLDTEERGKSGASP